MLEEREYADAREEMLDRFHGKHQISAINQMTDTELEQALELAKRDWNFPAIYEEVTGIKFSKHIEDDYMSSDSKYIDYGKPAYDSYD